MKYAFELKIEKKNSIIQMDQIRVSRTVGSY